MFRPKHTLESVATEVSHGLEDGIVTLYPDEPTEADVENLESMMKSKLAKYERRERAAMAIAASAVIATIAIVFAESALGPENQWWVRASRVLVGCIVGATAGYALGAKARQRSVELKIYIKMLETADASTARQVARWEASRLRERAPVP